VNNLRSRLPASVVRIVCLLSLISLVGSAGCNLIGGRGETEPEAITRITALEAMEGAWAALEVRHPGGYWRSAFSSVRLGLGADGLAATWLVNAEDTARVRRTYWVTAAGLGEQASQTTSSGLPAPSVRYSLDGSPPTFLNSPEILGRVAAPEPSAFVMEAFLGQAPEGLVWSIRYSLVPTAGVRTRFEEVAFLLDARTGARVGDS
jgi:hypothetical protein